MDLQLDSPIFRLPRELRDQIYVSLFSSTRLAFGNRVSGSEVRRIIPSRNSLAILRSCRRLCEETSHLWLGLVLFSFEHVEDLLDKFWALPKPTLSQIRFVRTKARALELMYSAHVDGEVGGPELVVSFTLPWVPRLLPGLRLDTLTVLANVNHRYSYHTLDTFIRLGHGWRQLHYISNDSKMLGIGGWTSLNPHKRGTRILQPASWQEALLERDGADSGSSVTIYHSTAPKVPTSVSQPNSRTIFRQAPSFGEELVQFPDQDSETRFSANEPLGGQSTPAPSPLRQNLASHGAQKASSTPRTGDDWEEGLLTVVRRGRDANISSMSPNDIPERDPRFWTGEKTWPQIKRDMIDEYRKGAPSPDEEVDVYADPYEYLPFKTQ